MSYNSKYNGVMRQRYSGVYKSAGLPNGPLPPETTFYYKEPIGGSTALERYLWHMDGQSMHWRRESSDYGQTTTARLRVAFVGGSGVGLQYLVGRHSSDRFYIALDGSKASFGNGASGTQGLTTVDLSKINFAEL
ncbi:unnamed protein product, partial [marine sediment metagenome]